MCVLQILANPYLTTLSLGPEFTESKMLYQFQVANKELVYAELDLEPSESTRVVRKPETEQIEYVELDFKKKPPPTQNAEN